jgi:hypothetical protein
MERAMCSECDDLRRKIALNRGLSIGPMDPASLIRNDAELKTLEAKLDAVVNGHFAAAVPSSQKVLVKEPMVH